MRRVAKRWKAEAERMRPVEPGRIAGGKHHVSAETSYERTAAMSYTIDRVISDADFDEVDARTRKALADTSPMCRLLHR